MTEPATFAALRRIGAGRPRRIPYVAQHESTDCAAACLAMVLRYHGRHIELRELRNELLVGRDGCTASTLLETAERHGLRGRGVALPVDALRELPSGSILHWRFNHYVVFERCTKKGIVVVDPALGRRHLDLEAVRRCFTGVAIWLERGESLEQRSAPKSDARAYFARMLRERAIVTRIVLASVVGRVLGLVIPVLTGLVVDHVVPRSDRHLLLVVGAAVAFVALFQMVAHLVRGLMLLELRARVDSDLTLGFLQHMLALPYDFFQRRQTGDLILRVGSHTQIREQVTTTGLASVLDGGFACAYLFVIAITSPSLAGVIAVLAALQLLVLLLSRGHIAALGTHTIEARSRAGSRMVQMIGGIEPLKLCGAERRAVDRWSNEYVDELNASLAEGRAALWIESALSGLRTLSPLLLLTIGTSMVLDGELSLGSMLTINALGVGVLGPLSQLVDALMRLHGLRGHFDRIRDVASEPREREGGDRATDALRGDIVLADVCFTYPGSEQPTLVGISFAAPAGSCVAIVGPSGSGKSTLARLLVGFNRPDSGHVELDGRSLDDFELRSLRRRVAMVPQRPYLFAGTLADNIALGVPTAPPAKIRAAAELAGIHAEIERMPMGYDTMVSEDGGSLSGGQRKRIALARALLADPTVLVLDEATSDLDTIAEAALTLNLAQLHCTRIVIAHRLSTILGADRVVVLDAGRIVESGGASELVEHGGLFSRLVKAQSLSSVEMRP